MFDRFWRIEEAVGAGRYIILDGIYTTKESAEAEIQRLPSNGGMRAVLYETSTRWSGGPVRTEEKKQIDLSEKI